MQNTKEVVKEKRPVLLNSQNLKMNMVWPINERSQIPIVRLIPNLENKLKLVKNNLTTIEQGNKTAEEVLLNKTSNVNADTSDKSAKNCNKALIGHCNQACTDKTELLNEVTK